jgi:uncharacterized membrane protein
MLTQPRAQAVPSLPWIVQLRASHRLALTVAAGIAVYFVAAEFFSFKTRMLIAWDTGASIYLGLAWAVIVKADAAMTRIRMRTQDQAAFVIFLTVVTAACASIVAIALLMTELKDAPILQRSLHLGLAVLALALSWLLIQTLFGFHYAHRYYTHTRDPDCEPKGLAFPGGRDPDFLDFAYFSFVVGMTSQTSDVAVTERHMRRLTLIHGFLSFVFNIAILAMAINIIAGTK